MSVRERQYARGCFPVEGVASREAASFLLTETHYTSHERLEPHDHELPCIVVLFEGSFVEQLGCGRERTCTAPFVIVRPARERHADVFGAGGARVLNVELSGRWTEIAGERVPGRSAEVEPLAQERLATDLLRAFRRPSASVGGRVPALVTRALDASAPLRAGRAPSAPVRLARDLAESRFRQPWALGETAAEVGMHPASLARAFRREYGEPLGAFVRRLRVREAYRLLATGSGSVGEVAQEAGFFDQAHLARVFRALVGMSPSEFRELVRD